jgi:hypothetical protein
MKLNMKHTLQTAYRALALAETDGTIAVKVTPPSGRFHFSTLADPEDIQYLPLTDFYGACIEQITPEMYAQTADFA